MLGHESRELKEAQAEKKVHRRYGVGTGALLAPLYGAGELPQAFCRVAAVAGALYVLRRPLAALLLRGGRCTGVRACGGQVRPV